MFIIEFKVEESAEKALAQIEEKGYAAPYQNDGRPIVKIGVNFSSKERTIEGEKSGNDTTLERYEGPIPMLKNAVFVFFL
ncbi:MAG: PD-(D/E)XK nuclease domain-containing protein [Paludibacteraceae bacterium]|nr:PD-(D/E)XK nuclease domain-containing protein [Paludibacteraceae bacterium]